MLTRHQSARDSLNSADALVERAPTLRWVTFPPARKSIASAKPGETLIARTRSNRQIERRSSGGHRNVYAVTDGLKD